MASIPDGWFAPATKLIRTYEGCAKKRSDGMFEAYPDPAKGWAVPTIGYGCTGHGITKGTVWSQSQCDAALLLRMTTEFGPGVDKLCEGVATTQGQKAALVSFAWNLGLGALEESTLLRLHRDGHHHAAADQFPKWVHAGGKVLPGLVKRRAAERAVYLGGAA